MTYACPMHPDIRSDRPGSCTICGMPLESVDHAHAHIERVPDAFSWSAYRPLFIILALIALPVALLTVRDAYEGTAAWWKTLQLFMAGFFLTFAGLKLIDLPGFAKGYATYDLLAKRVPAYGYLYPFLELTLGLSYLLGFLTFYADIATVILMTFGGIGVAIKLRTRERFACSCLGTAIKVPLTNVTLIENFGMAAMALAMLIA